MGKERICKCGHLRALHFDNHKGETYSSGQCSNCKCSLYTNRNLGRRKFGLCYGIGLMIFILSGIPLMYLMPGISTHLDDKVISIGLLLFVTSCLFLVASLSIIPVFITPYFYAKRRKEYPVE